MPCPVVPWTPPGLGGAPEQPLPMPDNPLHEEIPPHVQPQLPLAEPEAVSSCPIPCSLGAESDTPPSCTLLSGSCGEPKGPLPAPPGAPDSSPAVPLFGQPLSVSLAMRGPDWSPGLEVAQQCQNRGQPLPWACDHTNAGTAQVPSVFCPPGHTRAHVQLLSPAPLRPFPAFQPLFPQPGAFHRVCVT